MIDEITWRRDPNKQTHFMWEATADGIRLDHGNGNNSYVIPWSVCFAVMRQAKIIALRNEANIVTAGTSMTAPPSGSVGAWVANQQDQNLFLLPKGQLTPRHLSFIGPILGRM